MPGQFQIQSKHDHQKSTQKPLQPLAPAQTLFTSLVTQWGRKQEGMCDSESCKERPRRTLQKTLQKDKPKNWEASFAATTHAIPCISIQKRLFGKLPNKDTDCIPFFSQPITCHMIDS